MARERGERDAVKKNDKSSGMLAREVFRSQAILVVALALLLALAGGVVNERSEARRRDQNLLDVAETAARAALASGTTEFEDQERLVKTFDALRDALSSVDVISVVGRDGRRRYHTNHALIGKVYDGDHPDFSEGRRRYAENASGPSGAQRRAFAAIYDANGQYDGFVIAVMLREKIRREIFRILAIFAAFAIFALIVELAAARRLSKKIKARLFGHEPDSFATMYKIRDGILESLEEGVVSVDADGKVDFLNGAAKKILGINEETDLDALGARLLGQTLRRGARETNATFTGSQGADILVDRVPVRQGGSIIGAVGVLRDRTEYVRLAEDLSGARLLVDSMRANNHDFKNKLHVILGLLQMKAYDLAATYIEDVAFMQSETVGKIARAVDDPAIAALLVGKASKASELGVKFILEEGSRRRKDDFKVPSDAIITIAGNLIDNALEAMNSEKNTDGARKELLFGIHSEPGALLITVDDSGPGISKENLKRLFENGFTTKGKGRGSGLYQIKRLAESLGGEITVESEEGTGTSFSVAFRERENRNV